MNDSVEPKATNETKDRDIGKTGAPKITLDHIESAIDSEVYIRVEGTNVTICVLNIKNGFNVIGHSACVSDENFDAELGKKIARSNAINQCWPLFGFYLASVLTGFSMDS